MILSKNDSVKTHPTPVPTAPLLLIRTWSLHSPLILASLPPPCSASLCDLRASAVPSSSSLRRSMLGVRCSSCSMFDVRCSMFDVPPSVPHTWDTRSVAPNPRKSSSIPPFCTLDSQKLTFNPSRNHPASCPQVSPIEIHSHRNANELCQSSPIPDPQSPIPNPSPL